MQLRANFNRVEFCHVNVEKYLSSSEKNVFVFKKHKLEKMFLKRFSKLIRFIYDQLIFCIINAFIIMSEFIK